MIRFRVIELDILRGGETATYPVTADNLIDAVQKFYMMRKPPVSDHILVVPETEILENWRNKAPARKLYWKTEMDDVYNKSISELAALFIKEEFSLIILLMLSSEGAKTVEEISNEIMSDIGKEDIKPMKIMDIINKLEELGAIYSKDGLVRITSHGAHIVWKLRKSISKKEKEA